METGKVEYAPDYKSSLKTALSAGRAIADSVIAARKLSAEHAGLERDLIEAAKRWHKNPSEGDFRRELHSACRNLIAFESQHGIETKD